MAKQIVTRNGSIGYLKGENFFSESNFVITRVVCCVHIGDRHGYLVQTKGTNQENERLVTVKNQTRFIRTLRPCIVIAYGCIKHVYFIHAKRSTLEYLQIYNPGQNYLRKFSPSCPFSYATKLFPKTTPLRKGNPFPQFNVASPKRPGIRLSCEYTTTLLSGEGEEGRTSTATVFSKMLSKYTIFSTVLSKLVYKVICVFSQEYL